MMVAKGAKKPPDSKRLSLWPLKPKDALQTMLTTPLPGKQPRVKPEVKRKSK